MLLRGSGGAGRNEMSKTKVRGWQRSSGSLTPAFVGTKTGGSLKTGLDTGTRLALGRI